MVIIMTFLNIAIILIISILVVGVGWYFYSWRLIQCEIVEKKMAERGLAQEVTLSGPGFRFRTGLAWTRGAGKFTARQILKRRNGLVIGRAFWAKIQLLPSGIDREDYDSVGRRHARLQFDFDNKTFYLEDLNSTNGIYWSYLEGDGNGPSTRVVNRLVLDRDMRVRIGSLLLEIQVSKETPNILVSPPNRFAFYSLFLFQLLGLLLFFITQGIPTTQIWLPPALLALAAGIVFYVCPGLRPIWMLVLTGLTAAYFILILNSSCPESMAKWVCSILYPYGIIPLCLAKSLGNMRKSLSLAVKVAAAVALAVVMDSINMGDAIPTAILFLLLLTDDPEVQDALARIS